MQSYLPHCRQARLSVQAFVLRAQVYNITAHINNHPGWECACGISTVLAIMRVLGTDCSEEFDEVHTPEGGKKQLPGFCIGSVQKDENG